MRAGRALIILALALTAGAASAAPAAPRRSAKAAPEPAPVFLGYSYTQAGDANMHGIGLAGSLPFNPAFSFLLDIAGHDGSFAGADLDQLGLMTGVRWKKKSGGLRPFAEGLLGAVRTSASVETEGAQVSDSDTDWGFAFGGGLDFQLKERWWLRGLFHLRLLHGEGAWDSDPRFAVGVVYRLGR